MEERYSNQNHKAKYRLGHRLQFDKYHVWNFAGEFMFFRAHALAGAETPGNLFTPLSAKNATMEAGLPSRELPSCPDP
jgi:hypothetical protein